MPPFKFIEPVSDGVLIFTLLFAIRISSLGLIISVVFIFWSSIEVAGAIISLSLSITGSGIGVGKINWKKTITNARTKKNIST